MSEDNQCTQSLPPRQGLYDPQYEHDACGVGFVVNIKGQKSNDILRQALSFIFGQALYLRDNDFFQFQRKVFNGRCSEQVLQR